MSTFFRELAYAIFEEWLENISICILTYIIMFVYYHYKIVCELGLSIMQVIRAWIITMVIIGVLLFLCSRHP